MARPLRAGALTNQSAAGRWRDVRAVVGGALVNASLAEQFEELRPHLRAVAYGTLGTLAEADDVVQEAWLRLEQTDVAEIRDLRGFLTTVVGRLALDALGSARRRREKYVGPWLPEPLVDDDPADRVTLDESVTMALLVVLETLSPAERTAFVLHDVFGMSFADVAEVVGRSPAAVRQLGARARKHVDEGRPRFPASREEHERIVGAFVGALGEGDVDAMLKLLDPDVDLPLRWRRHRARRAAPAPRRRPRRPHADRHAPQPPQPRPARARGERQRLAWPRHRHRRRR